MINTNEGTYTPLIDFNAYPVKDVLDTLLQDKSTKQNIIYATDAYVDAEPTATEAAPILAQQISGETPPYALCHEYRKAWMSRQTAPKQKPRCSHHHGW